MNNSPVKSELYVALENGRINSILTIYKNNKPIDIGGTTQTASRYFGPARMYIISGAKLITPSNKVDIRIAIATDTTLFSSKSLFLILLYNHGVYELLIAASTK